MKKEKKADYNEKVSLPMVCILLSTYNGEKYLKEQLDSIFSQIYQKFILYLRDDGSSDNTVEVIHSYFDEHKDYLKKTVFLENIEKNNLGYMKSFWLLLEKASGAKYYAFCDQDDIWLPDKVQRGVMELEKKSGEYPNLYFSNFYQCSEDLKIKKSSEKVHIPIVFKDVIFYTPAFGFSILINEKLRRLALESKNHDGLPHDGWVQKIAAGLGSISYDSKCTAYYRRHENAVTAGNRSKFTLIKNWIRNDIFGSSMKENKEVLIRFCSQYGKSLNEDDQKLLELFTTPDKSISIWWKRVSYRKHLRPTIGGRIALKLCFLLNIY